MNPISTAAAVRAPVLLGAALALLLAGCAGAPPSPSPALRLPSPTAVVPVPASCPAPPPSADPLAPLAEAGPFSIIPADFTPVAALRCTVPMTLPGTPAPAPVAERLTTGLAPLLDALRAPWPRTAPDACPLSLVPMPYLLLIGADGRALRPMPPPNGCGQPQARLVEVLATLPWQPVGEPPR